MSHQLSHTNLNDNDKEEKTNLELITSSISVCISQGHTTMNKQVIEAARNYYLSIVNNNDLSIDQQRHKIYQDLVLGTKANLLDNNNNNIDDKPKTNKLTLSYRIGLDNDTISTVNGEIICVGQYKENDIYIQSPHVSRIHCFIFQINDKLIVLDGWSKCGTDTIDVAPNNDSIYSDTIHNNDHINDDDDDEHNDDHLFACNHKHNTNNNEINIEEKDKDKDKDKEQREETADNEDIIPNKNFDDDGYFNLHDNEDMDDMIEIKELNEDDECDNDKELHLNQLDNKIENNIINKKYKKRDNKLISSFPKQRNILQYNINDTIHLKLGKDEYGTDIIINPKLCIVCMEKARVLRLNCGHQVLCHQCYNKIKQNMYSSQCPICRKPFNALSFNNVNDNIIMNNNSNDSNNAMISAGVHTYAVDDHHSYVSAEVAASSASNTSNDTSVTTSTQ
mmetsp:Transcript_21161/g.18653  ORF Transcript_21161/g.18653 Transcript_21161/m.18653 type:complete len:450 (+) Transcript_21161:299-1648(+)